MSRTLSPISLAILGAFVLEFASHAAAQCDQWRGRTGLRIAGSVQASVEWDPDGNGPQTPLLVVGGGFDRAGGPGGVPANNIAAWNGVEWSTFGAGLDGWVTDLAVYNGQLIAAGYFMTSGGVTVNHIARWNGSTWLDLGGGLTHAITYPIAKTLVVYGGELIVGGKFTHAGSVIANNIARWNGTNWHEVSGGINEFVSSLAIYQDELVAGGRFELAGGILAENIARWDGFTWRPFHAGLQTDSLGVEALAVYGGQLYAGGGFSTAGSYMATGIARWDGNRWYDVGGGVNGIVAELSIYNGELVAGGRFDSAGGSLFNNVARWNGSGWQGVLSGTDHTVLALTVYGGELYVGGWFQRAGAFTVDGFARWNGANWFDMAGVVLSAAGDVRALQPWSGGVVLCGAFTSTSRHEPITVRNLALWDGLGLTGIGTPNGVVQTLATAPGSPPFSTDLIIGGWFIGVDGVSANRIARLNDTVATGWQAMGSGFNNTVYAIEYFNGSIYAAGSFTSSGTTGVSRIARWTGSAWTPLGSGLSGTSLALKGYNGELYVGGVFNIAGGLTTGHLARWNPANGGSWNAVGGIFTGESVNALEVYDGQLVIGGLYPGINNSPNLARWNGSSYSTFGVGGTNASVLALAVSDDTLVIGGDFTQVGGIDADHIARWNGSTWHSIRGGADDSVFALARYRNEVHVGGQFNAVRFGELPSERYARFSLDGVPWIADQSDSRTVACGRDAAFHTTPAQGYGVDYAWRKDGATLQPGPTGTGSIITMTDNDLYVENAGPDDEGTYVCIISNACGSDTSQPATLAVFDCCFGDLNADGQITLQDLALLLAHFGTPNGAAYADGDLDRDGDVELQDLAILLAGFGTVCA